MVRLFVRHPVSDFTTWKQAYDDFDRERTGFGVTGNAVFQEVNDPNDVTITHDFATIEEARAFVGSPRLKEAMDAAGVTGAPDIWFTNPA